jgi:hypothetical protein
LFGLEDHPRLDQMSAIGKRRFQIHEGDIGSGQHRREIAQRQRRIAVLPGHVADIARQHHVAAENQCGFPGARRGYFAGRRRVFAG